MKKIIRPEHDIPHKYLDSNLQIAGVDEAGRGPLAGSVVAAAVILDSSHKIEGLADSKKLSAKQRERLESEIKQKAVAWSIVSVPAERIDEINILNATFEAMNQAIDNLACRPDYIFIDGNKASRNDENMIAVIKGDCRMKCISAASILAKVTRDREMRELDDLHPQYGFAKHKGYPTKEHMEALELYGPVSEHRKSYAPVARLIGTI